MRVDPASGRKNYLMIQAEDELASIGMVIGASWNGARAFTATSGPGTVADAGIPRVWPTTPRCQRWCSTSSASGLPPACRRARSSATCIRRPTPRTAIRARCACIRPIPRNASNSRSKAFDLAERLQTPVLVLSDLDIGMNDWMCPEFKWDERYQPDRGKVLDAEQLAKHRALLALLRSRQRRHSAAHAARRASQGRLLRARLGAYAVRRLHRGFEGIPGGGRSAAQEMADRRAAGAQVGDRTQRAQDRHRHRLARQL